MQVKEKTLLEVLTFALEHYYHRHPDMTIIDILKAVEEIRHECTEEFIKAHPNQVLMLGRIR